MVSKSEVALKWPVFRPHGWGKPTQSRALRRPWWGLDTERDALDGRFVCGYAVGENVRRFERLDELPPGTYWVWNLAYDIEGMLRDVANENGWAARADGVRFDYLKGRAIYYHGKRFDYSDKDGPRSFIEASSFWGRIPLRQMGAKEGVDASKMSYDRYVRDSEYRAAVESYCIQDARIVYENVCQLAHDCADLGVEIGSTPGATARRFMSRMGAFPKVLWQTQQAFLRSYCGGRFEITKRGIFEDAYQFDIKSAYPWALTQCPWLTETAHHRRVNEVHDDALYGTYEVSFTMDSYLGLAPRWREGVRVYSKAQERTWLTKPEVDWLRAHGYDVEVHRGVEIYDENASDLWASVIMELFEKKQQGQKGAKTVLNSQYGVLIQLVRKGGRWVPRMEAKDPVDFAGELALERPPEAFEGGKYYAPAYAGNLTALTRLKVLDAALSLGESYIGGHTDSVLATKPLRIGIGGELGDWELEAHVDRAEVCKTGMYALDDKVKMRGITRQGSSDLLWAEAHTRNQRIGIKRAQRWDDVSLILQTEVANNYQVERKREWERPFTLEIVEAGDYIDSEALAYV